MASPLFSPAQSLLFSIPSGRTDMTRRRRQSFDVWLEDLLSFYGLDGRRRKKRRKTTWF
jgi:hypothetical protein